jgi:hypothetical protein
MTKYIVTRTWIAGIIVLVAGLILGFLGLGLMLAFSGTLTQAAGGSTTFIPRLDGFFWVTIGLMSAGFAIAAVGGIVQLAAWIGALLNTYRLDDKAWFLVLLIGGLLSFTFGLIGFAAMLAYVVAGPDGMAAGAEQPGMPMSERPGIPTPALPLRELVPSH